MDGKRLESESFLVITPLTSHFRARNLARKMAALPTADWPSHPRRIPFSALMTLPNVPAARDAVSRIPESLAVTLGSPDAWDSVVPVPEGPAIQTARDLLFFLRDYATGGLVARELPRIRQAWELASIGHSRELIELDRKDAAGTCENRFLQASLHVGHRQLGKLRPLRDHRVVQRYAAAVDSGMAAGRHEVVFGLALAVFGLPLRQGLLHYSSRTLAGFAGRVPTSSRLTDLEKQAVVDAILESMPASVNTLIGESSPRVVA